MNNQLTVFSPQKVMGTTRVTAERAAYQYDTYGTLRFWIGNECVAHYDGHIVNGYQVI